MTMNKIDQLIMIQAHIDNIVCHMNKLSKEREETVALYNKVNEA